MVRIYPTDPEKKPEDDKKPTADELDQRLMDQARRLVSFSRDPRAVGDEVTLKEFEATILPGVFEIGAIAVALYLACCESRIRKRTGGRLVQGGRSFQR